MIPKFAACLLNILNNNKHFNSVIVYNNNNNDNIYSLYFRTKLQEKLALWGQNNDRISKLKLVYTVKCPALISAFPLALQKRVSLA
jgi:hypothetical protein